MIELHCCDCMLYMRDQPDKAFDLAIVDPQYGINADIVQTQQAESGRVSNGGYWKKYKSTKWDSKIPKEEYFRELERISRKRIIWGGNYFMENLSGVIVWYKGKNGDMKEGELAKTNINTFKVFELSRIDAYVNNSQVKIHPTQKPLSLYQWLLTNYAEPGQRIFDSHLGSGSSAIAAHYFGVDFVGCEIDKDYFQAAKSRIDAETRQIAMF